MLGKMSVVSKLLRLTSVWAVRLGPGHLMMLSTVVLALVAEVTGGRVRGEARWLVSWDAGCWLIWLCRGLSWSCWIRQEPGAGLAQDAGRPCALFGSCWSRPVPARLRGHDDPSTLYDSALSRGWHVGLALVTVACAWMVLHTDFGSLRRPLLPQRA